MYDSKKLKFIKQQETSGLFSSFGIKTPLNKIPLLGSLLFNPLHLINQDLHITLDKSCFQHGMAYGGFEDLT